MRHSRIKEITKKQWLKIAFFVFIALPTAGFVIGSAGVLVFTFWPTNYSKLQTPTIAPDAEHIVVIAHGLRDTTASWSDPLKYQLERSFQSQGTRGQAISIDWSPFSGAAFQCSVSGLRIGKKIGLQLASSAALRSVHMVGHSCGAFVVLGICRALRTARANIALHTTYLDPVSIYGGLVWNYGISRFGSCADFSEAYIDTADGVPGSNELLPNTHTFDVTPVREARGLSISPHMWPTQYYQELVANGEFPSLARDHTLIKRFPRGELEQVFVSPGL